VCDQRQERAERPSGAQTEVSQAPLLDKQPFFRKSLSVPPLWPAIPVFKPDPAQGRPFPFGRVYELFCLASYMTQPRGRGADRPATDRTRRHRSLGGQRQLPPRLTHAKGRHDRAHSGALTAPPAVRKSLCSSQTVPRGLHDGALSEPPQQAAIPVFKPIFVAGGQASTPL
jgi:hypothetical protein